MTIVFHQCSRRAAAATRKQSLAACLPLLIAVAGPAAAADSGSITMKYDGVAHGLIVLKVTGALAMTNSGYTGHLTVHTAGMINWLSHMDNDSQVRGHFIGASPAPDHYDAFGTAHGTYKTMHLDYHGTNPVIEQQTPAVDPTRTPVPPDAQPGSIDDLSAIVLLVRQVGDKGTCNGAVRLFDGRRLTTLTAHTVGTETLPSSSRTRFSGQALRCDFDGARIAGFVKADNEAQQRRPRHGSAWLAQVIPGAPPVPVRVTFDNKILGSVTLYLTDVSGVAGPVAQNAGNARVQ